MEVLRNVISMEPKRVDQLAPHVPSAVGEVLHRALSKDPDQRFASIQDFAGALLRAAGCSVPPPVETLTAPLGASNDARATAEGALAITLDGTLAFTHPSAKAAAGNAGAPSAPNATAPAVTNNFTLSDLTGAIDRARQAHGLGDLDLAVNSAESALNVADALRSAEAEARITRARTLLDKIFEARLGSLRHRLIVLSPPSSQKLRVSPEQAFLLSRVDGGVTLEEALDLSPLPRQRTLRLLVSMLRQGLIAAE
jgi:hypothetical protein